MKKAALVLVTAALGAAPLAASADSLVTERSISLDAALRMATASLERCRADGYKVTITVLNRHARPVVVLSDAFCEPDRMRYAGAIEAHPETWLDETRWQLLIDNVHRAAELCRDREFTASFHPHVGTYVETPREVYALLGAMDAELLGLCFDTGHSAFGGGDPLTLLRDTHELVNHVHFKDVDMPLLARLHAEGKGLEAAWAAGVFCELGTGGAHVAECLVHGDTEVSRGVEGGDRRRAAGRIGAVNQHGPSLSTKCRDRVSGLG